MVVRHATPEDSRAVAAIHVRSWQAAYQGIVPAQFHRHDSSGWVPWLIGPSGGRSVQTNFGETFFRYMAFGRPDPSYDWLRFDIAADYDKTAATRATLDATNPDLSPFKARGGKILSYFGWADPALNPMMGVSYYGRVVETMGPATQDFYRLFMVPGMSLEGLCS